MAEYSYNEAIFNEKYNKYYKLIYRISYQYLLNVEAAEDVTQDVFVKLFTNKKSFDNNEHEKAWLIRITINKCKNILNSKSFKNLELFEEIGFDNNSFEENSNKKIDLMNELKKLTPEQRTAIYLFYYEGYSIKDISKNMNAKENTVKSYLKRAKQSLKMNIKKE